MKKFIQTFLSKKSNRVILAVILLLIVSVAAYILTGVTKNVRQMADATESYYFPAYPVPNLTGKNAVAIKRGEYLVKAGDCIACHTNTTVKGPTFSGGLPMHTPFGVIYTPNITPDKETGIGNWTDEQFIKAMREGLSPSGERYYPAFPYPYFNKVTTEDLKDIKAYLDNIPAIHQENRKNEMIFPFNLRFLQFGWRVLFFNTAKTGPYQQDPSQSATWNRGAYLVEGLGHCAMCHTPSYYILNPKLPLGAPIRKYNLTGAQVSGYLAPNITKMNLGAISNQQLVEVFTKDRLIGGNNVQGPMLEVNHDSLIYLTPNDLSAIATYLKSVESKIPEQKRGNGAAGKPIYDNYCSGCHTLGAGGAPKIGDATSWRILLNSGVDKVYAAAISGAGGMPPMGTCNTCSKGDIKDAVDYILAASLGDKTHFPPKSKLTIDDGARVYQQDCSVCHAHGFKNAPIPGDKAAWKKSINAGFLETYLNVVTGRQGHPHRGACAQCTDEELLAAVKYMMQESATDKNYNLW